MTVALVHKCVEGLATEVDPQNISDEYHLLSPLIGLSVKTQRKNVRKAIENSDIDLQTEFIFTAGD